MSRKAKTASENNHFKLEDAVFESGAVKHASQFKKRLEEIANYVQKKYNSNVAKMIKNVECPIFEFPVWPVPKLF